jgi:hypothetical protein
MSPLFILQSLRSATPHYLAVSSSRVVKYVPSLQLKLTVYINTNPGERESVLLFTVTPHVTVGLRIPQVHSQRTEQNFELRHGHFLTNPLQFISHEDTNIKHDII